MTPHIELFYVPIACSLAALGFAFLSGLLYGRSPGKKLTWRVKGELSFLLFSASMASIAVVLCLFLIGHDGQAFSSNCLAEGKWKVIAKDDATGHVLVQNEAGEIFHTVLPKDGMTKLAFVRHAGNDYPIEPTATLPGHTKSTPSAQKKSSN